MIIEEDFMAYYYKGILFIENKETFVNKAVKSKLDAAGFRVVNVKDDIEDIEDKRFEGEMIIYNPSGPASHIEMVMRYLGELSRENHKSLCLFGDYNYIDDALRSEEASRVTSSYVRPVDIDKFIQDMLILSQAHDEYKRTKNILIIDDDSDYLNIIKGWLSLKYSADAVRSSAEALFYLTNNRPDLILMDYEMPIFNGDELMEQIRKNPHTYKIPVIFLTGHNDRNSVMKILSHKPDGYLLKSSNKQDLLDALDRFFSQNILIQKSTTAHI